MTMTESVLVGKVDGIIIATHSRANSKPANMTNTNFQLLNVSKMNWVNGGNTNIPIGTPHLAKPVAKAEIIYKPFLFGFDYII